MLRKLVSTLALLALPALSAAPLVAQDSAAVAKAVNDLEIQWGASMAAGNWDAVQSFLTPDFLGTTPEGQRLDRAAYIASLRDSGDRYSNVTAGPYTVLVRGGTAVHLGEWTITITAKNGKATRVHMVWTDVWVLGANGQWLCLTSQVVQHPLK